MIRIVPGANVEPAGGSGPDETAGSATGGSLSERPRKRAAPTTATRTSSETTRIQGVRFPVPGAAGGGTTNVPGRAGGARTGEDCTATPGPAGVATSDHVLPFHQRTIEGAPSGSGYHPGAGG